MARIAQRFRAVYGSHPLHLLTMVSGFALLGYILVTFRPSAYPAAFWNPGTWWQSIAVWFAAAVIGHDLLLFPVYALADRILAAQTSRWSDGSSKMQARSKVLAHNYIRVPALAAGLTLFIFLPGIIEQGAPTYHAATGQTQQPFLGRWLLLTAAMFAVSAVVYAARLGLAHRQAHRR